MRCPKCKATLKRVKRADVTVDSCELCYGIWLDKGELERIASFRNKESSTAVKAINSLLNKDTTAVEEQGCECPICSKTMQKIKFDTPDDLLVDKCTACAGIWFDKGELISVTDSVEHGKTKSKTGLSDKNVSLLPSILTIIGIIALLIILSIYAIRYFR